MNKKRIQLRKGIFELVILQILKQNRHYGYSLIKEITNNCNFDIGEGTIYPILSRISKEGLIESQWVESSMGPPRKYYSITSLGISTLNELDLEFQNLSALVFKTKKISASVKIKNKKIYPRKEKNNDK